MSYLVQLPAPQAAPLPFFDVVAELDGVSYTLSFRWNDRAGLWFLTVLDEPGQAVLLPDVACVSNFPLYRHTTGRPFPGWLYLSDTTGQGSPAGLGELGGRVRLYYFSAADLGL